MIVGKEVTMRKLFVAASAAGIVVAMLTSASAAMMHPMMHPKHMMTKCTGEFMYWDTKTHKCLDSRQS
jgi:hypothetical protein